MVWYHEYMCLLHQPSLSHAHQDGRRMKLTRRRTAKTIPTVAPELRPVDSLPERRGNIIC